MNTKNNQFNVNNQEAAEPQPPLNTQAVKVISLAELYVQPEEAQSWVVDGLLSSGGISVFAGKPKCGKSTLARQLAVSITQGHAFLGRAGTRGPVLYLPLEEKLAELKDHMRNLGASGTEALHVLSSITPGQALKELADAIDKVNPVLAIIDPLFRFIDVNSASDYQTMNKALEPIMALARAKNVHIMCVHHMTKASSFSADGILGSTAIFGGVDTAVILMEQDGQRVIASKQRGGVHFEPTALVFDSSSRKTILGSKWEVAQLDGKKAAIVSYLKTQAEGRTESEIKAIVPAKTEIFRTALRQLVSENIIYREGRGTSRYPFLYFVTGVIPDDFDKTDASISVLTASPTEMKEEALVGQDGDHSRKNKGNASQKEALGTSGASPPQKRKAGKGKSKFKENTLNNNNKRQRSKTFGRQQNPSRTSPLNMKMMNITRDYVRKTFGIDLVSAEGKRDENDNLNIKVSELPFQKQIYDVFTPEGQLIERERLAQLKEINKQRKLEGKKEIKRVDPKPHWVFNLETQPSVDAAVHEIAHVLAYNKMGVGLRDMQIDMDDQWEKIQGGETLLLSEQQKLNSRPGHLKQKLTAGEVQVMSIENKIRRALGFPANRSVLEKKNKNPVVDCLDGSGKRLVPATLSTGTKVYFVRQTRLANDKTNLRFTERFTMGTQVFNAKAGWSYSNSSNSLINLRALAKEHSMKAEKHRITGDYKSFQREQQLAELYRKRVVDLLREKFSQCPHLK